MESDPQLEAMTKIVAAMNPLESTDREIVLEYLLRRYGVPAGTRTTVSVKPSLQENSAGVAASDTSVQETSDSIGRPPGKGPSDFADLYHRFGPVTDADKALVAGYWLSEHEGLSEGFDSFGVNSSLKSLGYPVGNITRALDQLQAVQPQLVMQTRKSGTSKQARKSFRMTHAGIQKIRQRIGNPHP
jgi:hypothetical protein